jgi:hypothetical protein
MRPSFAPAVMHWNGKNWTVALKPGADGGPDYTAVSADAQGRVWVVGYVAASDPERSWTLAWYLEQGRWHRVPTPYGTDSMGGDLELNDVTSSPSDDIWAVGNDVSGNGDAYPLIAHSKCR